MVLLGIQHSLNEITKLLLFCGLHAKLIHFSIEIGTMQSEQLGCLCHASVTQLNGSLDMLDLKFSRRFI